MRRIERAKVQAIAGEFRRDALEIGRDPTAHADRGERPELAHMLVYLAGDPGAHEGERDPEFQIAKQDRDMRARDWL